MSNFHEVAIRLESPTIRLSPEELSLGTHLVMGSRAEIKVKGALDNHGDH